MESGTIDRVMDTFFRVVRWAALTLLVGSVIAALLGEALLSFRLTIPVLIVSGWAAGGHLVTLDDDAPGGFFNQDESKAAWRRSLMALLVKIVLFGLVVSWALWQLGKLD